MEANRLLTVDPDGPRDVVDPGCPKCGEPWDSLAPVVEAVGLAGARIRRCRRCGTRATGDESPARVLRTCDACGLPFLESRSEAPGARRCERCAAEAASSPEREVVEATEAEVRGALDEAWSFVAAPGLSAYLDGVVREMTACVDGVPGCRVVLLDDPMLRSLALPSGAIVLSVGLLRFLHDEAELAFVVGRELAFLASGEAAGRLVRGSFGAVARDDDGTPETVWTDAVSDWIRLGYGRRRELDADARALRMMLAMHYDPGSALRFLRRLHGAIGTGDPHVAEIAVAQPPPAYRIRKLERILYGRVGREPVQRVNREVFRRAARAEGLSPATLEPPVSPESRPAGSGPSLLVRVVVAAVGIAALGALLIALARMLG